MKFCAIAFAAVLITGLSAMTAISTKSQQGFERG